MKLKEPLDNYVSGGGSDGDGGGGGKREREREQRNEINTLPDHLTR